MKVLCPILALVLLASLGCNDITSPVERGDSPSLSSESTQAKWDNNPGNLRVYRDPVGFFAASWTDPETGLRATHTTVPLGAPGANDCGLLDLIDPVDHQDVLVGPDPSFDGGRIIHVIDDELWIIVRDLTQPGDCFGAKLVAEGPGDFHGNDNDVSFTVNNNDNTWGFSGHGNLTTPDGGSLRYNGHVRFIAGFDQNDEDFFRVLSAQVVTN